MADDKSPSPESRGSANFQRTRDQLYDALREQRSFLRASCEAFDKGMVHEAKRIATTVSLLVHDPGGTRPSRTKSLLGMLELKNELEFVNSSRGVKPNLLPSSSLTFTNLTDRLIVLPNFLNSTEDISRGDFSSWWDEIIYCEATTSDAPPIRRKDLVQTLRSQDGGSHLDESVDHSAYADLVFGQGIGWSTVQDGQPNKSLGSANLHLAAMRQIGWEMEQTLSALP